MAQQPGGDDEKASEKIMFVDYNDITLEQWFKNNYYSFLIHAFANELSCRKIEDIKPITESHIDRLFKNVSDANRKNSGLSNMFGFNKSNNNNNNKDYDKIGNMTQKSRAEFKRKFEQFRRGYLTHLGAKGQNVNQYVNPGAAAAAAIDPGMYAASAPNAEPLDLLAQNYETTVEFIKRFKGDIAALNKQKTQCEESLHMEYNTAVKGITEYRDEMLKKLDTNFNVRLQLLQSQLNLLESHLKSNEKCEQECDNLAQNEVSNKCNNFLKPANLPEVLDIPYSITIQDNNLKDRARDYGYLFSKLKYDTSIDLNNLKKLHRLPWRDNEGGHVDNKWRDVWKKGSKVDAFDKQTKKWYAATIRQRVNVGKERVEVRFDGFNSSFDIWMDVDSANLAVYKSHTEKSEHAKFLLSPKANAEQIDNQMSLSNDEMDDDIW